MKEGDQALLESLAGGAGEGEAEVTTAAVTARRASVKPGRRWPVDASFLSTCSHCKAAMRLGCYEYRSQPQRQP
jgi:hypothetical protein